MVGVFEYSGLSGFEKKAMHFSKQHKNIWFLKFKSNQSGNKITSVI